MWKISYWDSPVSSSQGPHCKTMVIKATQLPRSWSTPSPCSQSLFLQQDPKQLCPRKKTGQGLCLRNSPRQLIRTGWWWCLSQRTYLTLVTVFSFLLDFKLPSHPAEAALCCQCCGTFPTRCLLIKSTGKQLLNHVKNLTLQLTWSPWVPYPNFLVITDFLEKLFSLK